MNAAFIDDTEVAAAYGATSLATDGKIPVGKQVGVAEFRKLAVSHRRMDRVDLPNAGLKGLRDVETGETFYTDAHRLAAK